MPWSRVRSGQYNNRDEAPAGYLYNTVNKLESGRQRRGAARQPWTLVLLIQTGNWQFYVVIIVRLCG